MTMPLALPTHLDNMGVPRGLGRVIPPVGRRPLVGAVPVIPSSEWERYKSRPYDYKPPGLWMLNQGSWGACNPHAAITGMHILRILNGYTNTKLSPWYVYAHLCNGIDTGSNIGDALGWLRRVGTCPDSEVAYGTIDPRRIAATAETHAARFRAELAGTCTRWEEIISSVIRDEPVNLSLRAGDNFSTLDKEGVVGYERGDGNHAVCAFGGLKWSAKWGWLVKIFNSWSEQWGWGGCAWVSEGHTVGSGWFEAYSLRSVQTDPGDPMNVPALA